MNLSSIIIQFSAEENLAFKAYLRAKNKRPDTKNAALYALLRKNTPLKNIDVLLYGKPNRNAYHALSKRLQDNLIDFIASRSFEKETSEDIKVFKWILTARILYEQNNVQPALKLLLKASKKAKELDLYTALIECDDTQLQYSHLHPEVDLKTLTKNAQENLKQFQQQQQLNMAYAHIKGILIFDEQLLATNIQKTIEEILTAFDIQLNSHFTFKSLYKLLEIINTAAHLEHNFVAALPFIAKTYDLIKQKKVIKENQQYYHIQVLYYMSNAHFRVRDFKQASHYLLKMEHELRMSKESLAKRFRTDHLLIQSLTLNYDGKPREAIALLENYLKTSPNNKANPDCILALVVCLIQQQEYQAAHTAINTFNHSDSWYKQRLGLDWVIKKELVHLILFYELEYIDLVQSYLGSFNRKYKGIINSEKRLQHFITVFSELHKDPSVIKESRFRESIKSKFTRDSLKDEDIFMLSFFAWIKAKLNQTPLYQTTLDLL